MIGDHVRLLNRVRDRKTLEVAFQYALHDRVRLDYYYDCFEVDFVVANRQSILAELSQELADVRSYRARPAYAYYAPKNELCYRRMIYIPFKDLIVRYAFVMVLADLLDRELSQNCFANRRARGERAKVTFLEDFSNISWPKFCRWQKDCASRSRFTTLFRTDISAFYDSVSHDYLMETITRELAIGADTDFIGLFHSLLRVPVISYSHLDCSPKDAKIIQQGLSIGNNTEGVLANLYLKAVDEAMHRIPSIEFGRYNDDMRIFAAGRRQAQDAVLVLQEHLLSKGLNLNAAKTKRAESPTAIEHLRSKAYEGYEYVSPEEGLDEEPTAFEDLDQPFDTFSRVFETGEQFSKPEDAKEFCQFMSHRHHNAYDLLPIEDRKAWHVEALKEILSRWHGSSKHAAWLMTESACDTRCPKDTRHVASETLIRCLFHEDVATYAKYRILHHLVKLRRKHASRSTFRYIDTIEKAVRERMYEVLPGLLQKPAFELNIIALYTLRALGSSPVDLKVFVENYAPKPIGIPVKNALFTVLEPTRAIAPIDLAGEQETDGEPEYY